MLVAKQPGMIGNVNLHTAGIYDTVCFQSSGSIEAFCHEILDNVPADIPARHTDGVTSYKQPPLGASGSSPAICSTSPIFDTVLSYISIVYSRVISLHESITATAANLWICSVHNLVSF